MSDTTKPDFAAAERWARIVSVNGTASSASGEFTNLALAYLARTTVTEGMCKAAARELAAQMGEPLIEDAWTAEDTKDWTHILTAALEAR